jgi:hypothetical protein
MYKNRISRTSTDLDLQSFIQRCDIAYDERARYVEFVCNIWNEGRFGPDLADPATVQQNDRPALEPASFLDHTESAHRALTWPAPIHSLSILGRAGHQVLEAAYQRAKQTGLIDAGPAVPASPAALSPNQGRGSP